MPTRPTLEPAAPSASWADLLQGANALRSIALAGGVALHAINVYIVTTILPTVIRDIGGLEYYAWNTTLFVVTSIIGSALSAKLIETLGPRSAYLFAVAVFSAGAVICATAPDMPVLLAGRSVQGLGGGVLFALSYALIRLVFDAPLWSRAMALVSCMWGVATLSGPAIGGIFAQAGNWRLAFWALLPVAALLALIVAFKVGGRASVPPAPRSALPLRTLALLVVSVIAVTLASLSTQLGWNVAGIAAGLIVALLIARVDARARYRLLPTGAYSLRAPLGALYATMCLVVAAIATEIFVPYFLQVIHGMSPLKAGYLTAAMGAGWTLAAMPSAHPGGSRRRQADPHQPHRDPGVVNRPGNHDAAAGAAGVPRWAGRLHRCTGRGGIRHWAGLAASADQSLQRGAQRRRDADVFVDYHRAAVRGGGNGGAGRGGCQ